MKRFLLMFAAVLALSGGAKADIVLTFTIGSGSGNGYGLGYDASSDIMGARLNVINVFSNSQTPLNAGVSRNIISQSGLAFFTGSPGLVSSDATHWLFNPVNGGVLEAGVDLDNDGFYFGPGDIGFFSLPAQFNLSSSSITLGSGGQYSFTGSGVGAIDPLIAAFYGVGATAWNVRLDVVFDGTGSPPGSVNSTNIISGSLVLTAVPEPSGVVLGLTVAGFLTLQFRRRNYSTKQNRGSHTA